MLLITDALIFVKVNSIAVLLLSKRPLLSLFICVRHATYHYEYSMEHIWLIEISKFDRIANGTTLHQSPHDVVTIQPSTRSKKTSCFVRLKSPIKQFTITKKRPD